MRKSISKIIALLLVAVTIFSMAATVGAVEFEGETSDGSWGSSNKFGDNAYDSLLQKSSKIIIMMSLHHAERSAEMEISIEMKRITLSQEEFARELGISFAPGIEGRPSVPNLHIAYAV